MIPLTQHIMVGVPTQIIYTEQPFGGRLDVYVDGYAMKLGTDCHIRGPNTLEFGFVLQPGQQVRIEDRPDTYHYEVKYEYTTTDEKRAMWDLPELEDPLHEPEFIDALKSL